MPVDVAIFLDLDNLVIGAKKAKLVVDLNLISEKTIELTDGRLVFKRAYGDGAQARPFMKALTELGYDFQPVVRMNNYAKNLADMKIVVDAMETIIDGHDYHAYVFVSGDRDFTPMVQSLRKRGKFVYGIGVRHTTSQNLASECDEYFYYEDLLPVRSLNADDIETLLQTALHDLLQNSDRVRASILKQRMDDLSNGAFMESPHSDGSFRKFLEQFPQILSIVQEDTTIFAARPDEQGKQTSQPQTRPLFQRYRSELKKKRLRVVPWTERLMILNDMIHACRAKPEIRWKELAETLSAHYQKRDVAISKNLINDTMLVARRAEILQTQRGKSLATAVLFLDLPKEKPIKEAVIQCDLAYLREIVTLTEPFEAVEASRALYDSSDKEKYIQHIVDSYGLFGP